MKKKILLWTLIVLTVLLMASTTVAINYSIGCVYSHNTGSLYFGSGKTAKNQCTGCRVYIYGTRYEATEETYLLDSSNNRQSARKFVTAGNSANYTPYITGVILRLHIVNHDYYGHYEMLADGNYTIN